MLFCDYRSKSIAQHWASAMQESKEVKIASVWGGVLDEIDVSHNHKYRQPCVAVLITGSIQTWSTILDKKCDTEEQVETKLKLFKDEVKLKKHSIGFMFASKMHRGYLEEAMFKRLFPKVPLANCFGSGSFGKTTTIDEVNEEKNDEEKSWYNEYKYDLWTGYNEYSTVFLILTYG
ncbi:uncharacterized protein LOC112466972 isoform X2 [Temnothorax curvispinosus]|nr:uncharacterized protein LOC112466972 isoform X2 [Temnothorax curvispinosus]